MVITKREDVTKQGVCILPLLLRKLRLRGLSLFILVLIQFQTHCHLRGWGGGRRLYERLFEMGANSRLGASSLRTNTVSSVVTQRSSPEHCVTTRD